jgi:hypothetical protein
VSYESEHSNRERSSYEPPIRCSTRPSLVGLSFRRSLMPNGLTPANPTTITRRFPWLLTFIFLLRRKVFSP